MHVDDGVEGIYRGLCIRRTHDAEPDKSMSLTELRLALGVMEAGHPSVHGTGRASSKRRVR